MTAAAPSRDQFDVLLGIAGARFDYAETKRLCVGAGWQPIADEPKLGFVQYALWLGPDQDDGRLLSVGTSDRDRPPHIYLPLYYFPEEEGTDPGDHERTPFDDAYRSLAQDLDEMLGAPRRQGKYGYPHRPGWPYSFRIWRVREAQVVLLQDEHDIQFGMDVSLWLFAAEREIEIPFSF